MLLEILTLLRAFRDRYNRSERMQNKYLMVLYRTSARTLCIYIYNTYIINVYIYITVETVAFLEIDCSGIGVNGVTH